MSDAAETSIPSPRTFPWQRAALDRLRQAWRNGRFPHALLLQGADGLGKRSLAAWLAAAVLCDRSSGGELDRCGQCASCALIDSGAHPDLQWVAPEQDKQQISIDQVRSATERLTRTSYRHGYKAAVVEPAHQMTPSAANSLLKTLEEPSSASAIVLSSSRPSLLLPTIRSRCLKLTICGPSRDDALAWLASEIGAPSASPDLLAFAGHAPLRALEYAHGRFDGLNEHMQQSLAKLLSGRTDVTQTAAEWEKDALIDRLIWLELWLGSLARETIAGTDERITFPSGREHLPTPPTALNISGVYNLVDRTRGLRAQLARTSLQRELAVESWLLALLALWTPAKASVRGR